jgi:hypothetical protein
MANKDNLDPVRDTETAKARGKQGGIKSGEVRREKKMMSQIYAEFLEKEHDVVSKDGIKKSMSGHQLLSSVMSKVLSRGDSAAVSLMKEIREATEGNNINIDTNLPITINIQGVDPERSDPE